MIIKSQGELIFEEGEYHEGIVRISSSSPYKKLRKGHKVVSRRCSDVILELDDDYSAAVFAITNYKKSDEGIVFCPTLIKTPDILRYKVSLGYVLAKQDGLYFYPYDDLRRLLIESEMPKGGLPFLDGWRKEREFSRKEIEDLIEIFKNDNT